MSTLKVDAIRHNSATSDAITTASDGTCTARITGMTGGGGLSHRNIIINGACMVAQRGVTSTSGGYHTVDRLPSYYTGGGITQSQGTLTSGTPFEKGFTNYFRVTNSTAYTSADGARSIIPKIEAQDIRNSGWNYQSSSSFITFSFYVRSSVTQEFYAFARTNDGTMQRYPFSLGTLSANTWTKVTKTIPGNSNLTFDNDSGRGLDFFMYAFLGTDYTSSGVNLNAWGAYTSADRTPDFTNTWASTTNATFDVTGLQLEVGDTATSFEHRSYGDELARCQRYYIRLTAGGSNLLHFTGSTKQQQYVSCSRVELPTTMRAAPSISFTGTRDILHYSNDNSGYSGDEMEPNSFNVRWGSSNTIGDGTAYTATLTGNPNYVECSAEL